MPYKDRQKYLEYQKAYYQKHKRSNIRSNSASSSTPKFLPGLTGHRVLNPGISIALEKSNSIPQNQRVTEKLRMEGWEIDGTGNARRKA